MNTHIAKLFKRMLSDDSGDQQFDLGGQQIINDPVIEQAEEELLEGVE